MNRPTACLIAALLTTAAQAGIDIPKSVYKADQVEAACAEAVKENKALAFVLTDPGTSCGLCIGATDMAFEKLKAHSVVVFLNSEVADRWEHIIPDC